MRLANAISAAVAAPGDSLQNPVLHLQEQSEVVLLSCVQYPSVALVEGSETVTTTET